MKIKNAFVWVSLAALISALGVFIANYKYSPRSASIITSNFVAYDFARAITGDASNIGMLLKPGAEAHDYEPSPQDIKNIIEADFFIYTGGESDEWVEDMLRDNNIDQAKTIKMMDFVELKTEEVVEGMETEEEGIEEEGEYDEHIWTSPVNAIRIIEAMRDRFVAKNAQKEGEYTANVQKYIDSLNEIDKEFRAVVKNTKRKELVFGDRFPFRYFVDEYGLEYSAAFSGCSDQTEASSSTIAYLVNKVKNDQLPVVLKIELTSGSLAQAIADETGAKILTLNAAHNISQADFDNGKTYADIMRENINVIREALN